MREGHGRDTAHSGDEHGDKEMFIQHRLQRQQGQNNRLNRLGNLFVWEIEKMRWYIPPDAEFFL